VSHVAPTGEAHALAETLMKPCAVEMAECMFNKQARKKLETIQLLNNTVHRFIQDLPTDIEHKMVSKLQSCDGFSLKINKSIDVSLLSIFIVFVCCCYHKKIKEGLL
jgi:hypothetical protein